MVIADEATHETKPQCAAQASGSDLDVARNIVRIIIAAQPVDVSGILLA